MNVTISRTNDPFKKYWWVILVAFGVVGGFVCMPGADAQYGSGGAGGERGFKSGEQSLDSSNNPGGAPGSAVDLSMEGTGAYRKHGGDMTSSLYQASADEAPASSATVTPASGSSFADALRSVAKKSSRSASADASGWGGEKAQKGFTAPKGNFSAMAGAGGGGGSVSASFSAGGGGAGEGLSAFGSGKANTGVSMARGLGGGVSEDGQMKNATASMRSLNSAANGAISASGQKSNDLASAMGGRSFDGSGNGYTSGGGSRGAGIGDEKGTVSLGGAGIYGRLDAAPKNLKANDSKLDQKTITPPAAAPVAAEKPSMKDMIMQMVITGLIGAVMKGLVGALI